MNDEQQPSHAVMSNDERLTAQQLQQADGIEDWRVLAIGASAWFGAPSHTAGAALVRRIADLTENTDRPPDVDHNVARIYPHRRLNKDLGPATAWAYPEWQLPQGHCRSQDHI